MDGIANQAFHNQVIQDIFSEKKPPNGHSSQEGGTTSLSDDLLSVYRKLYLEALTESKQSKAPKEKSSVHKKV